MFLFNFHRITLVILNTNNNYSLWHHHLSLKLIVSQYLPHTSDSWPQPSWSLSFPLYYHMKHKHYPRSDMYWYISIFLLHLISLLISFFPARVLLSVFFSVTLFYHFSPTSLIPTSLVISPYFTHFHFPYFTQFTCIYFIPAWSISVLPTDHLHFSLLYSLLCSFTHLFYVHFTSTSPTSFPHLTNSLLPTSLLLSSNATLPPISPTSFLPTSHTSLSLLHPIHSSYLTNSLLPTSQVHFSLFQQLHFSLLHPLYFSLLHPLHFSLLLPLLTSSLGLYLIPQRLWREDNDPWQVVLTEI